MQFQDTSQGGEATHLRWLFRNEKRKPYLVDVGAYGKQYSNTWPLLVLGWKGLLIEANPNRVPVIEQDFAGLDYALMAYAVGTSEGFAKLRIHAREGSSSLLSEWEPEGCTGQEVEVPVRDFIQVLRKNLVPVNFDLLCIDTEGMDKVLFEYLMTSEFRPRFIMTEAFSYGTDEQAVELYKQHGYRFTKRFEPGNQWGNFLFELGV
jgi:FkbM family methyltransferase